MKKSIPAWAVLGVITLVAGLLLGLTNDITAPKIEEASNQAAEQSRRSLMPSADKFEKLEVPEDGNILECYLASENGTQIGYVVTVIAKGYGGNVEVIAGFNNDFTCTGITVGGKDFSETSGLGAKAKEPAFTDQFAGKGLPMELNGGNNAIQAITSATITSKAVVGAVNAAGDYVKTLADD